MIRQDIYVYVHSMNIYDDVHDEELRWESSHDLHEFQLYAQGASSFRHGPDSCSSTTEYKQRKHSEDFPRTLPVGCLGKEVESRMENVQAHAVAAS